MRSGPDDEKQKEKDDLKKPMPRNMFMQVKDNEPDYIEYDSTKFKDYEFQYFPTSKGEEEGEENDKDDSKQEFEYKYTTEFK